MLDYAPLFMVAGVALIVITVAIYYNQKEAQRARELANFANQAGLQALGSSQLTAPIFAGGFLSQLFSPTDPMTLAFLDRFQGFQPFGTGYSPATKNLMIGTKDGVDWYLFDYYYTTGSGKNRQRHHYGVMAARVPFTFPKLSLKPENILTKIGEHLGLHELHFEVDEFNRRYFVRCDDEKAAYDIICPQVIEYLLQQRTRWWQLFSMYVLIVDNRPLNVETCYEVMQEIPGLLTKLPNYVKQDIGFQPRWANAYEGP